ncbi:MAG: hypothetical protein JWN04_3307, partial [Myxococcaceae bacterium]|nr:hypothetical protein [Myxococcaceae bacterium]
RLIIYSSMALTFLVIGQFSRNQFIYFQF